ncbi:MAG: glycoside hydrolase family 127 protein [Candidatus Hydrogenedentes bacterium]|nr:glycoside hydrolase family 127 protein [Candidatus Hydrogenedentota bacterium]
MNLLSRALALLVLGCALAGSEAPMIEPGGELQYRIAMAQDRMLHGTNPVFTDDFIIADVALRPDYPRRFASYSGDISGRYLGAFACMPPTGVALRMERLVDKILACQKPDGRFGSVDLQYTPDVVGLDHMALLWGNGRLLVGLLEYNATTPSEEVLSACKRSGDFLISVSTGCMDKAVVDRVTSLGAAGMICLSQLVEPLMMLAGATGDAKYREGAIALLPWFLQERGAQHTHGYLTTLRGIMMLHASTRDEQYLTLVKSLYDGLINSPDYLVYGGVREYFGDKFDRDEGCSEADFIRLSLMLWETTGDAAYLERAERCLLNQFYNDQFATGDFGHHPFFSHGVAPSLGQGRAWWCCTMHGLRAFRDVADAIVRDKNGALAVNLFLDAQWDDGARGVTVTTNPSDPRRPYCAITADRAPEAGIALRIRKPSWTSTVTLSLSGNPVSAREDAGYLVPETPLRQGDTLDVSMELTTRLLLRDGSTSTPGQLTEKPLEAALFHGPWLLSVNESDDPLFYGEPWMENVIELPATLQGASGHESPLVIPRAHITCEYVHGGYPDPQQVTLQPISEGTRHEPAAQAVWLRYRKPE